MTVALLFLACFSLGLLLTVASLLGGHLHVGHVRFHAHHGTNTHGAGAWSWLNGFSLAAFLCWFGAVGYLLQRERSFTLVIVLLLALLAGCAGAAVLSFFLTGVLMKHERPLLPEDTEMRGVLARVSSRVRAGGTGEIVFTLNGTRRCSGARASGGERLERGAEVVVLAYSHGIASIAPFHGDADAALQQQHPAPEANV